MRALWLIDIPAGVVLRLSALRDQVCAAPPGTLLLTTQPVPEAVVAQHLDDVVEPDTIQQHNERVTHWVDGLTDELENGRYQSIAEHRGVRLWSGARHTIFFSLQRAVASVATASRLLQQVNPSCVHVLSVPGGGFGLGDAVVRIAASHGVPVTRRAIPGRWHPVRRSIRSRIVDRFETERARFSALFPASVPAPPNGSRYRVLVPEFYPAHRDIAGPLFRALARNGCSVVALAHRRRVALEFESLGVPVVAGYRLGDAHVRHTLQRLHRQCADALDRVRDDADLVDAFSEAQVDVRDVCWERVRQVLLDAHQVAAATVEQCLHTIERWRPHAVLVMTDTSTHGRVACLTAAAKELPSVDVQHGVIYEHALASRMAAGKQAVWGEGVVDVLVSCGNPPQRMVVTGSAKYDRLFDQTRPGALAHWVHRLFPPEPQAHGDFRVVYTTQPPGLEYSHEEWNRCLEAVFQAMRQHPNSHWVLKLHPADRPEAYKRAAAAAGVTNAEIRHRDDTIQLMAAAHVVITLYSTTGIEAMLLEKPLIQLNLSGLPERVPYAAYGAALAVRSAVELPGAISRAVWDVSTREALASGRKAYLDRFVAGRDGKAADRVACLVTTLIEQAAGRA